jgi:hypothetical protein
VATVSLLGELGVCTGRPVFWNSMLPHGVPQAFPICLQCLWLLVLSVLTQCSCVGLLWWGELWEERPPRGSLGSSLCSSPFAWLQPRCGAGWGFSLSTRVQLQQLNVQFVLIFSGHSLCRWPPPHHKYRGGCLQLAYIGPKFSQL